jgi:uncharacterized membrane protein YfcA
MTNTIDPVPQDFRRTDDASFASVVPILLLPVLVWAIAGMRRAHRSGAGLKTWSPVLIYLAGIVAAFVCGSLGLPGGVGVYFGWTAGVVGLIQGIAMFFTYDPANEATPQERER